MKKAEIKFKFTTPAFLAGADQNAAEMRIPSVKGVLRWWCRNLGMDEKTIFGHAGEESRRGQMMLRDLTTGATAYQLLNGEQICGNKFDYFLWPFRRDDNKRGVIMPDRSPEFHLMLSMRGDAEMDAAAVKAFLLLGALGTRSRRAYGSIWPTSVTFDGVAWPIPQTTADFIKALPEALPAGAYCVVLKIDNCQRDFKSAINCCSSFLKTFRCGSEKSGTPSPWGKNDHDMISGHPSKVYRAALGLPLVQRYSNGKQFESCIEGFDRLASPILFKVVKLDGGFVPIATIFTSNTPDEDSVVLWRENLRQGNGKDLTNCKTARLSLELLDTIAYPDNHKKYWSKSTLLGEFYP